MAEEGSRDAEFDKVVERVLERHLWHTDTLPQECPADVADTLLQILERGLVYARAAGWSENAELSALEADHLHNLPELIRKYQPRELRFYWNYTRSGYRDAYKRITGQESPFEELWEKLEALVRRETAEL